MNLSPALLSQYREALAAAEVAAPESERSLITSHGAALAALTELLTDGAADEAILSLVRSERRSFGWSFLSGSAGEAAERAFHALALEVERLAV